MTKVICFGAAGGAIRLYPKIIQKYQVIAFTDNDSKKWGTKSCGGVCVYSPNECINRMEYDYVIITSAPGMQSIKKQLIDMGISETRIITSYVDEPLRIREIFLSSLAKFNDEYDVAAECAEAGVFEGDFARHINCCFPNRKLHLFDTFEGFDARDIEREKGYSLAQIGDYSNTSITEVMGKMSFPEQCIIHKGYFPETAEGLNSRFCFVNLDLDLYEPTYNGLWFFKDKMIHKAVILVHDYFAENFEGPKEAVDKFVAECGGRIQKYPIGDGISIMLTGF